MASFIFKAGHSKFLLTLVSLIIYIYGGNCSIEKKCSTCKEIVENFEKGLKSTSGQNFGGGNTDWEESRLGSYANSETRLVEIIEGLCKSSSKESLCHGIVEQHEEDIEHWWFKKRSKEPDLKQYLCMSLMKVCCPDNTYGPECKACPGGTELPCNDHGSCEGAGTRSGSGKCSCHSGYLGDICDECEERYYESNKTCEMCHESCESTCSGEGPQGCDDCASGWKKTEEKCVDNDECEESPCEIGKYCVNNPGSYSCRDCDKACEEGCTGYGAANCKACKSGYTFEEGRGCVDNDECKEEDKCDPGSYCYNTKGSYECKTCHESCELDCSGPDASNCKACKSGYEMIEGEGCKDIDDCVVDKIVCEDGKYCKNLPGRHSCEDCDKSCSSCFAPGPEGCSKCSQGYERKEQKCKDINECENNPCHSTERCINMKGSHRCDCKSGYTRKDGLCTRDKPETENDDDDDDDDDDDHEHEEL